MIREYQSGDMQWLWNCYKNYLPELNLRSPISGFSQFADAVEKDKTFIYNNENINCGFITSFVDEGSPWIWTVVVRLDWQNKGIATRLINKVEEHYKNLGYSHICLYVADDNPAQKLYFDLGYRVVRVMKGVYGDKPALKMVKYF